MYYKHHTKGIVVGNRIDGDSSKRIDIFTENFGLINARVQGARSIYSKMRGGSQNFSFGEFSLVRGKRGWKVVSIRSEKNFFEAFRNFPSKLKIVSNVLNLIKKLVAEEIHPHNIVEQENHASLFVIVLNFLIFLITAKESDIALAECLTLIRILFILGYLRHDPELLIPISSAEIAAKDLKVIAPRRFKVISLINESLKAV